jgi:hypothetical protein
MCLQFAFLLITRVTTWLRLSRRQEAWQTAEILILRHQLAVLQRRRRPHLTWADRALLAALLSVIPKARRLGLRLLVTPDTILRWHRDSPPLKLVLNSPGNGPGTTINHPGVEVETPEQVEQARQRLENAGLSPVPEDEARCCYARQAKVWVHDPDGADWEYYTILAGLDTPS